MSWNDLEAHIRREYGLGEADVEALLERLMGLLAQDPKQLAGNEAQEMRNHVAAAAKGVRQEASKMRKRAEALRQHLTEYRDAVGDVWPGPILKAVFEADLQPTDMDPGPELNPLRTALMLPNEWWEIGDAQLLALEELPVRKIKSGSQQAATLRDGLEACRVFWLANGGGRTWSRNNLADGTVIKENKCETLKGDAERFAADMLTAAEFQFTLSALNSAWTSNDRDRRKAIES